MDPIDTGKSVNTLRLAERVVIVVLVVAAVEVVVVEAAGERDKKIKCRFIWDSCSNEI